MSHISALHFATTYKWVRLYRKDNRWFISNKMRSIYVRKVSDASGRRGNQKQKDCDANRGVMWGASWDGTSGGGTLKYLGSPDGKYEPFCETQLLHFLGSPSQHKAKKVREIRKSDTRFSTREGFDRQEQAAAPASTSTSTAQHSCGGAFHSFIHSNALAERPC